MDNKPLVLYGYGVGYGQGAKRKVRGGAGDYLLVDSLFTPTDSLLRESF